MKSLGYFLETSQISTSYLLGRTTKCKIPFLARVNFLSGDTLRQTRFPRYFVRHVVYGSLFRFSKERLDKHSEDCMGDSDRRTNLRRKKKWGKGRVYPTTPVFVD